MWLTLEEEEDEDEEEVELGRPPKLMLIFGRSARNPSCHSLTLRLSIEPLLSPEKRRERSVSVKVRPATNPGTGCFNF